MSLRDLLLTLLLVGGLPIALRRPYIGALVFAFISLANPHRFTWGFAYSMPWAFAYAAATMAGLAATQERLIGDSIRRYWPMLLYLAWMGITSFYAFERGYATSRWVEVAKIHVMCLVTLMLLTDWTRVRLLLWVTVASVAFFGFKGGIFTLLNGGQFLVWGPPDSAIEDNNHLAVGLVMVLPLLYWLYTDTNRRWVRALIVLAALMSAVSIFGSHSRSAFLGIVAMSLFLLLKSHHKFPLLVMAVALGAALVFFMPQQYWDRMKTIETYEQDASAMGRINVWKTAVNIANDRLTGGGFEYYSIGVFKRYAPDPDDIHSSHSIYFQALGEHGWIGLGLFLSIWAYVWFACRKIIARCRLDASKKGRFLLARMLQVSIVGFAVGGAFVNIGNWDMAYYLAVAALATLRQATSPVESEAKHARESPPRRALAPRAAIPARRTETPGVAPANRLGRNEPART